MGPPEGRAHSRPIRLYPDDAPRPKGPPCPAASFSRRCPSCWSPPCPRARPRPGTTENASTDTTVEASTATTQPSTSDTATSDTGTGNTGPATRGSVADSPARPASRAGSCPTQDQVDSMQSELEAASGGASSSDQLAAEYDAAFGFLGAYLPDERQADLDLVRNCLQRLRPGAVRRGSEQSRSAHRRAVRRVGRCGSGLRHARGRGGQLADRGLLLADLPRRELRRGNRGHDARAARYDRTTDRPGSTTNLAAYRRGDRSRTSLHGYRPDHGAPRS